MLAVALLAVPLVVVSSCSLFGGGVGVSVGGEFGKVPDVEFPDGGPDDSLAVETLEEGDGAEVREGDLVVADYVGYRWNDEERKLVASSYAEGEPGVFPTGTVVPGLAEALVGARAGRVWWRGFRRRRGSGRMVTPGIGWVRTTRWCTCWTCGGVREVGGAEGEGAGAAGGGPAGGRGCGVGSGSGGDDAAGGGAEEAAGGDAGAG
ncbi:FKBP-type peptidyl-prolyl cis-trans isomerase [Actinomadura sp. WMMB 499]|uniref:FKBP-type peptidyl-prolyl cis-trans isomerase n=1 Tax=Actinomadura sp. WMMB 499 TaxID=1219491 RepID=UPI00159D29D7|nr:FKBP-type peptidyl-prolyl cis-trans isomerase [Actinomadura sp. WMMB 499]